MNLYFVLEGKQTEKRIYHSWLAHVLPQMTEVVNPKDLNSFNYYLLSCGGYPAYLQSIPSAHEDVRKNPNVSHLFICIDAEEASFDEKLRELQEEVDHSEAETGVRSSNSHFETHIVVQDCCIETWLLGNVKMMATNPSLDRLVEYRRFFDIRSADPEKMGTYPGFTTRARFHEQYLRAMFQERNVAYSKSNPGVALKGDYFEALRERAASGDISSFGRLVDMWSVIAGRMPT